MPIIKTVTHKIQKNEKKDIIEKEKSQPNEMIASDGKSYKFLGSQWAEVLTSGKTGRLAKKKIAKELDKFAGIKRDAFEKSAKKKNKVDIEDNINKVSNSRMGIFSMLFVFILFIGSIVLLLDTFKHYIIPFWPDLENYLVYAFETLNNIYILVKDFVISYK